MMGALRWMLVLPAIALLPPGQATGQETGTDPVQIMRPVRALQDRIARGDTNARDAMRAQLTRSAAEMSRMDAKVWKEARNVRAAVAFVLSGGDPGVLKPALAAATVSPEDQKLMKGAVAYAEGRGGEAAELMAGVSALTLDSALGGHVALVQAELVAKSEPARAMTYLDEARLLAPGTLIEEAALRRQISLATAAGQASMFETLTGQYLRRFPKSFYASSFKQQFAAELAGRKGTSDGETAGRLEAALAQVEVGERRDVYLLIATEAITRGKMDLVRFAAGRALRLAAAGSAEYMRSTTYEAAAMIVTGEFEKGFAALREVDKGKLQGEDAELLDAALAVANHVRDLPLALGPPGPPPPGAAVSPRMEAAKQVVARVDELLSGQR